MSVHGQRVQLGPFFSAGAINGAALLWHYNAGLSSLKNIWEERTMNTTLAQPFAADADGIFNFFADGLYKFVITEADGTVLYTLDNWQFLDPSDPTFSEGVSIPSSSTTAIGPEVWAHLTGSADIDAFSGTVPFFWAVIDGNLTLKYSASLLTPMSIDLAVRQNDVVFLLYEGSNVYRVAAHYQADGLLIATQDSRTTSTDNPLTIRSTTSGTPATGIGIGMIFQAESADESPSNFGQLEFVASDVTAGSEDTYFQIIMRVAGAILTSVYRFVALGAFKGIFTHSNSADRTYSLPDFSGTVMVTGLALVGTGELKTATGSATCTDTRTAGGSGSTTVDVTMNDYSFFPSLTHVVTQITPTYGGSGSWGPRALADPANTIGRVALTAISNGDAGAGEGNTVSTIRWRYFTATDNPHIWVMVDQLTGEIIATWFADDPPGDGSSGLAHPTDPGRYQTLALTENDLEAWNDLADKADEAADYIRSRKMKQEHVAMRALQLVSGDMSPANWLAKHLTFDTVKQKVVLASVKRNGP